MPCFLTIDHKGSKCNEIGVIWELSPEEPHRKGLIRRQMRYFAFWCAIVILSRQSGYIDGPVLTTFHTNLVVLPAVMEYMQYIFISLGLATIIVASVMHHKAKVSLVHNILKVFWCSPACCTVLCMYPPTNNGNKTRRNYTEQVLFLTEKTVCKWLLMQNKSVGKSNSNLLPHRSPRWGCALSLQQFLTSV